MKINDIFYLFLYLLVYITKISAFGLYMSLWYCSFYEYINQKNIDVKDA